MAEDRDHVSLTTPEQVEVSYELAGLGSRFLAGLVDTCLIGLVILALSVAAGYVRARLTGDPLQGWVAWAIVISAYTLLYVGYFVLFEMTQQGQGPGKRITGLRVIATSGASLSFEQSAVRNILRIVDMLPFGYGVALVSILVTKRMQRLGDVAAGTMVVKERMHELPELELSSEARPAAPPPVALPPEVTEEVMRAIRVGIRSVSREEVRTMRHFLERRFELEPEPRARLAAKLAGAIRPHFTGLADGQLSGPELLLEVAMRAIDEAE